MLFDNIDAVYEYAILFWERAGNRAGSAAILPAITTTLSPFFNFISLSICLAPQPCPRDLR